MSARADLQHALTENELPPSIHSDGLDDGVEAKKDTYPDEMVPQRQEMTELKHLLEGVSQKATALASPLPIATPSRNAMRANKLIAAKNRSASRHRKTVAADFRASSTKPIVVNETRETAEVTRAGECNVADREQPIPSLSKTWNQSGTQRLATHEHCQKKLEIAPPTHLDRMIGVEEGAGWFSPSNGASQGDSDDERDIAQQPSVISLPRAPSPAPMTARSKIARLRNIRSKSPAFQRDQITTTEFKLDHVATKITNRSLTEHEDALDTASVIQGNLKTSSLSSKVHSRSSHGNRGLDDVADKEVLLQGPSAESSSHRMLENAPAQVIFEMKRDEHRRTEALWTDSPESTGIDNEAITRHHALQPSNDEQTASIDGLPTSETSPETESMMSNTLPQGSGRESTRAERYAALKHKAEQRLRAHIQISSSSSSGNSLPPVHPVYGLSNKKINSALSGSRSSDIESISHSPSSELSISTNSSQGGPRASRLAAIRNGDLSLRIPVLVGRHTETHSTTTALLEATHEISQLEMYHTPRGSTTVIPTFDNPTEHTLVPRRSAKNIHRNTQVRSVLASAQTVHEPYDPWVEDAESANSRASFVDEDHMGRTHSTTPTAFVASSTPGRNEQPGWLPIAKNEVAVKSDHYHKENQQSNFLGANVSQAPDINGLDFSSGDASLSNLLDASSNDVEDTGQDDVHNSANSRGPEQISLSRETDPPSRRSDQSSLRSDPSIGSKTNKNPLRWWQKKYGKTTTRDTNAIISRALETVQLKVFTQKHSDDDTNEDVFDGLDESIPDRAPGDSSSCAKPVVSSAAYTGTDQVTTETSDELKEEESSCHSEDPLLADKEDIEGPLKLMGSSVGHTDSAEQSQMTTISEPHPEESILIHLGYAFVSTMQNACRVDLLHEPGSAEEHGDEFDGDVTSSASSARRMASGCTSSRETASSYMNEEDRLQWKTMEESDGEGEVKRDVPRSIDNIESSDSNPVREMTKRTKAQEELLAHASYALARFGGAPKRIDSNTVPEATTFGESVDNQAVARPSEIMLPVVTDFIDQLKTDCIEVLKLGRQNKWQLRLLAASNESVTVAQDGVACWQCPKALLWLKSFDGKAGSLKRIRKDGRGGLHFTDLFKVESGFGKLAVPSVPRRLIAKFPRLTGVLLTYKNENGKEKLTVLAFKNQLVADKVVDALTTVMGLV